MIAISAARISGGQHPILLLTPIFDTRHMSPVRAMAYAALKRFSIAPPVGGDLTLGTVWEQIAAYKVIPANRASLKPKHEAVFVFEYVPDREERAATEGTPIADPFADIWYLKPMEGAAA